MTINVSNGKARHSPAKNTLNHKHKLPSTSQPRSAPSRIIAQLQRFGPGERQKDLRASLVVVAGVVVGIAAAGAAVAEAGAGAVAMVLAAGAVGAVGAVVEAVAVRCHAAAAVGAKIQPEQEKEEGHRLSKGTNSRLLQHAFFLRFLALHLWQAASFPPQMVERWAWLGWAGFQERTCGRCTSDMSQMAGSGRCNTACAVPDSLGDPQTTPSQRFSCWEFWWNDGTPRTTLAGRSSTECKRHRSPHGSR